MLPFVNAIITLLYCIYLMHSLHHILLDCCKYLKMQSYLWQMVCTRATKEVALDNPKGSIGRGRGHGQAPCKNAPPPPLHPPVSLEQLLTKQNELMSLLVQNEAHRGV
jgi:hypothetical protein